MNGRNKPPVFTIHLTLVALLAAWSVVVTRVWADSSQNARVWLSVILLIMLGITIKAGLNDE